MTDPFRHHPELRRLIVDPEVSDWRHFDPEEVRADQAARGDEVWLYSEEEREADRARWLAGWDGGDLWVFAYGSLMWDPGLRFAELRHAFAPQHARAFILRDVGARGTPEQPGVMAALDEGTGCHGLAFRIRAEDVERETELLWRRERIAPAYHTATIGLETAQGPLRALAFVADHDAPSIAAGLSWDEQVRFCATGVGFLGTSRDYVENLARHFEALGVEDEALFRLRDAARAFTG